MTAVVIVAPCNAHGTERLALAIQSNASDHSLVGESAIGIVAVKVIWRGIVGNKQVRPAVIVVITPSRSEPIVFFGVVDPGFSGDLFECAVAAIVVEKIRFPFHTPRSTLHGRSLELAEFG